MVATLENVRELTGQTNAILISVKELIGTSNALLSSQGEIVFDAVIQPLEAGELVKLDFSGLNVLTSGFCNASVGRVFLELGAKEASQRIEIVNLANLRMEAALEDAIRLSQNPSLRDLSRFAFMDDSSVKDTCLA